MGLLTLFVTFEGGEGVGKSTQVGVLADWLRRRGHAVTVTREPGGTVGAEGVRHVLLSGRARAHGPDMEALLFAAARYDNVEQNIKPALTAGHVVLCDRYIDSSRVYQGVVGGVTDAFVRGMEEAVVDGARPDLTLVFDMPVERSMDRLRTRQSGDTDDRFEAEAMDAHRKRRKAFLDLAAAEPDRCKVIDADRATDDVSRSVIAAVSERLDAPR